MTLKFVCSLRFLLIKNSMEHSKWDENDSYIALNNDENTEEKANFYSEVPRNRTRQLICFITTLKLR